MSKNKTICKITEQDNEFVPITLHIDIDDYDELLSFIGFFEGWDDDVYVVLEKYKEKMIERKQ